MPKTTDLRFGVMGTALIATKIANAIHSAKGARLDVIASRNLARAKSWARRHKCPRAYASYEELLDDAEIDAVYIPLPNSMHHEWTIRAAEKGKHVLCEKPIAASYSQAVEMADACRQHGVQLMDGVMWVHHSRAAHFKKQIDKGALGTLRRLTSAFTFLLDKIPKVDIRLSKELAGGSLGDLGWYCMRLANFAFEDLPKEVYATARWYNGVDMNLSAVLWYDKGRMASFDSGFDIVMRQWFEIAGTKASMVCDDFVLPNSTAEARYFVHGGEGKKRKEHVVRDCDQIVAMIEDFTKAVKSGKLNTAWPRETLETMQVMEAVAKSAKTGSRVEL